MPTITFRNNGQCLSKLTVLVFYTKLGIQNTPLNYIIDIRIIQTYAATSTSYTLDIQFVDYGTLTG